MILFYFITLILFSITHLTVSSIIKDTRENELLFTPKPQDKNIIRKHHESFGFTKQENAIKELRSKIDNALEKKKMQMIKARNKDQVMDEGTQLQKYIKGSNKKQRSHGNSLMDDLNKISWRRRKYISSSISSSSSMELKNWKDEWKELWLKKKFEAINSSVPLGDTVNMAAARPWGLPCGDPNQYDMPWGTCMLPMECEAEYRIFRGDYFCGRTEFVCCALQLTTYDMYQGFDVSFADTSLETDSEERKNRYRGSKEKRFRKKIRDRRRRRRERLKRKRKIKRNIKKIIREIRKILNRSYRNGTTERKRKTRQLKKFVKMLKKKYKEERKVIMDIHEIRLIQTDAKVQEKLNQIKNMNRQFIKNGTYRDIIVNGTIDKDNLRLLLEVYPELASTLNTRRGGAKRPKDYLDYDIEYGYLYY